MVYKTRKTQHQRQSLTWLKLLQAYVNKFDAQFNFHPSFDALMYNGDASHYNRIFSTSNPSFFLFFFPNLKVISHIDFILQSSSLPCVDPVRHDEPIGRYTFSSLNLILYFSQENICYWTTRKRKQNIVFTSFYKDNCLLVG